jgi:hypothetical protein
MPKLLSLIFPKVRLLFELQAELEEALEAVVLVLAKYSSDSDVQAAINQVGDVRRKIREIVP